MVSWLRAISDDRRIEKRTVSTSSKAIESKLKTDVNVMKKERKLPTVNIRDGDSDRRRRAIENLSNVYVMGVRTAI
jgi:hypothetical protein